jgi:hypothetical protein
MNFPSKVTPYNLSLFPLMTRLLGEIQDSPMAPSELFSLKSFKGCAVREMVDALDALYALGKIEFDESGMRLRRVEDN